MAHKKPPKSAPLQDATADAASGAIGFALNAIDSEPDVAKIKKALNLAELCEQAADHMALAHNLLVTHESHTDTALDHLDAALGCLRQLVQEGEKRRGGDAAAEERSA
ncbi:MAG: hypothetical protein Kow0032_19350 [Methyloligellaceae bacterium]